MYLPTLEHFFFWWMIIDLGIYLLTVVMAMAFPRFLVKVQGKLLGVDEVTAKQAIYYFIAAFKLFIIVFNFSPWVALVIVS